MTLLTKNKMNSQKCDNISLYNYIFGNNQTWEYFRDLQKKYTFNI